MALLLGETIPPYVQRQINDRQEFIARSGDRTSITNFTSTAFNYDLFTTSRLAFLKLASGVSLSDSSINSRKSLW